jgi:GntR family transcriptional regulator
MSKNTSVYLEIADAIRHEILSKELPVHTRLPSEPELAIKYGAARATIRRALAKLQDQGLIYSRQAVGTFVAEPRIEQDLDQLFSFTEFMVYRGMEPGARLIRTETQQIDDPESPLLHYLGLRPGARLLYIRRLRLGGSEPLVIANTWLPEARFPDFWKHDLEQQSVYEILGSAGHKPTDAVQTMEAVNLDGEDASLLTVAPGSPALLVRRVAYASGVPVEYAVDLYRGDRTKFRVRLGVLEKRLSASIHSEQIAI